MEVDALSADLDSNETCTWDEVKSMGQESDESKMCVEGVDSLPCDLLKGVVTSPGVAKLSDEGDAKSEVLEADTDKKSNSSHKKRFRNEINDKYFLSMDLKRKKDASGSPDDDFVSVVADSEGGNLRNDNDVTVVDPKVSRKEVHPPDLNKQPFGRMLDWLTIVAKDPCHPAVTSLPERPKWKSHGNEELWKQVLLVRDAMKRHDDVATDPQNWQNIQKMHPAMYEDRPGTGYKFRERTRGKARSSLGKGQSPSQAGSESFNSGSQSNFERSPSQHMARTDDHANGNGTSDSSTADSFFWTRAQQKVPLGPQFQAKVPEWDGTTSESDPKWLGTRVWPLEKTEHRSLIERDPIGKGRQDSCGCQIRGSEECIKFHIAEKRMKVKLELGSAFYRLKQDKMGEEVELSWTEEEQKRFAAIVKSNPQSQDKCFWDQIFNSFRKKKREELVSYYFNVFLLKRRAYQNRFTKDNIDSDDDESETSFAAKRVDNQEINPSSSIFYSPAKSNAKFR